MDRNALANAVGRIYRLLPNRMPGKRRFAKLCLAPLFRRPGYSANVRLNSGPQFHGPLDDWIVWQIFLHGCYWAERRVESVLLESVRQSDVIFDVGAHMGYYSTQFADQTQGQVHAFEPNPQSFEYLRRNIEANGLQNIRLNPAGVSSQSGRLTLNIPHIGNSGSSSFTQKYATEASDRVEAEVTTPSDYCDTHGIEQVGTIKIDVEGHEFEVIKGLDPLLSERRVWRVFMEWNATTASHSSSEDLFGRLSQHGYVPWAISDGRIIPFNQQPASLIIFEAAGL